MIESMHSGGGGDTDKENRKSVKLLRRAVNEKWNIPPEVMKRAPEVCANLMENAESERTSLQAIGTLVAMSKCNVDITKQEKDAELIDHLLERFPNPTEEVHDAVDAIFDRLESEALS